MEHSLKDRWVRVYKVLSGDVHKENDITLHFIGKFESNGKASQYLHSKECFIEHLRKIGVTEAQFVIIADHQHYCISPVTVVVTSNLNASGKRSGDSLRGKVLPS